jgi:hypothetical protein
MHLQASWVAAAAEAEDGLDFARRMEAEGVMNRIDKATDPEMFRGATASPLELDALRTIERVERGHRVRHIGTDRIVTDRGEVPTDAGRVHIDCTAQGVRPTALRPVFEEDRISLEYVTIGVVPFGAAVIGAVEASGGDDAAKNNLCPPLSFTGRIADIPALALAGMSGLAARTLEPDVGAWAEACRLNPAKGAAEHLDDPRVQDAFKTIGEHLGAAMTNLERLTS